MSESAQSLKVAAVTLGLCLAATSAWRLWSRPGGAPTPQREAAPDFELRAMRGPPVRLSALRGQVVLVDFWATWCGPCREELPMLVRLAERLERRGLRFVAISEDDPPGQEPDVAAFARRVPGLERYVVYGDPEVESRFGVRSLPTLFVVDREGRVGRTLVGSRDEAEVSAAVEAALAERQ